MMATYPTPEEVDLAIPVDGNPVRSLTNEILKGLSIAPTWAQVTGKPATFQPVIGTTSTTAKAGNWVPAWSDVTGKPSTFAPSAHTHSSADISDATTIGKSVLSAATQAAARSAIGAGTSSLTIGTTSTTAKAGDYQPTWSQVTGKPVVANIVSTMPETPTSSGNIGDMYVDSENLYVYTAAGTWLKASLVWWGEEEA